MFDDLGAFDTSEFKVEALKFIGESMVVDTELLKDGGVEIVDGNTILRDGVAEFVGGAVGRATFDSGAGHPEAPIWS